jgi:hypothetical protein
MQLKLEELHTVNASVVAEMQTLKTQLAEVDRKDASN